MKAFPVTLYLQKSPSRLPSRLKYLRNTDVGLCQALLLKHIQAFSSGTLLKRPLLVTLLCLFPMFIVLLSKIAILSFGTHE